MRLANIWHPGQRRLVPCVRRGEVFWDLQGLIGRPFDAQFLVEDGLQFLSQSLRDIGAGEAKYPALAPPWKFGPILRPNDRWQSGGILCLGMNFRQHALKVLEMKGIAVPIQPVYFQKPSTAICGVSDPIRVKPEWNVDWEIEPLLIVGKRIQRFRAGRDNFRDYIVGMSCHHDISGRRDQFARGQWHAGKAYDGFAPIGPELVTIDEISDPNDLDLYLHVKSPVDRQWRSMQRGNTKDLLFGIERILEDWTDGRTLLPGDMISLGTPEDVGAFLDPPEYLQPGYRIRAGINGIGEFEQEVIAREW